MALSTHSRPDSIPHKDWVKITLDECQELGRLVALNGALSGKGTSRMYAFELITPPEWKRIREQRNETITQILPRLDKASACTSKDEYIEALAENVNELFSKYLEMYITDDPTSRAQFRKDLETIQSHPPADRTTRGNCGPTFMISYPRWEHQQRGEEIVRIDRGVSCVLKYTDPYEVASHRFLESLATGFTGVRNARPGEFFSVPRMTVFDLQSSSMAELRESLPIDERVTDQFARLFGDFVENYHPNPKMPPSRKSIVVRLEKVPAQNFPEFLAFHYQSLSQDVKMSLFRRLGRIAYLDFVMGNNDRLIAFNPTTLSFENEEANLGNLMASRSIDGINLFLIDNGINIHLCQREQQQTYLHFLKTILSSQNFEKVLANLLKKAIIESLKDVEQVDAFKKDLQGLGLKQIANGIKNMEMLMASQISQNWTKATADQLKLNLSSLQPDVTISLNDRIRTATEIARARNEAQARTDQLTPVRCPETVLNANVIMPTQERQTPTLNILWNIHQHCRGSLEDETFFKNTVVPLKDENQSIQEIYDLFHKVQRQGMLPETLTQLKELTEKTALEKYQVTLPQDSPTGLQSAPTPNAAEKTSSARATDTPPVAPRGESQPVDQVLCSALLFSSEND